MNLILPVDTSFRPESNLPVDEFIDVLVRSSLAKRRPVANHTGAFGYLDR